MSIQIDLLLPPLPEALLREVLRHKLLDFLYAEGVLDAELAQRMLRWRHSGFSVHNQIHTKSDDAEGVICSVPTAPKKIRLK